MCWFILRCIRRSVTPVRCSRAPGSYHGIMLTLLLIRTVQKPLSQALRLLSVRGTAFPRFPELCSGSGYTECLKQQNVVLWDRELSVEAGVTLLRPREYSGFRLAVRWPITFLKTYYLLPFRLFINVVSVTQPDSDQQASV